MRPGGSGRLFRREREMVRVRKICFLANDISLPGGLDRVNAALACALAENCAVWIGSLISGGKSWQREILFSGKVRKTVEFCMYRKGYAAFEPARIEHCSAEGDFFRVSQGFLSIDAVRKSGYNDENERMCPLMTENSPLLFQRVLLWLGRKARENRVPLCAALIFGFLAHGFAFANKLVNHDEANALFSKGGSVVLGRWGLCFMDNLFPNVSMPWIYGIVTICLLAVAVCVLARVLPLKSRWAQVLAAGLVVAFPSLTGTFGYMFMSTSHGLAFLLTALAAWFVTRRGTWFHLAALGCLVFALGIYQAFIGLCAGLLVIVVIRRLLEGEDGKAVLRDGLGYILFLALSLGLYYGIARLALALTHQEMANYATDGMAFSPLALPANALLAYRAFLSLFTDGTYCLVPTEFSRVLHGLLWLCAGILLIVRVRAKKRNTLNLVLLIAALVLFPLAVCCIFLFIAPASIHTIVLYSVVDAYLLMLMLADSCPPVSRLRRAVLNALPVLCALIVTVNIYIANESYLTLHLRYENAYAFYTSLIADIKASPEFTQGSKLAVIGSWQDPAFYEEHLGFTNTLTGVTGFKPDSYSKARFLEQYVGFAIPFATQAEEVEIAATQEFAEMPVYPYYGSMKKIGDTFVVKLSD